ncbi:hypothetical protein RSOLAG22IIIB_04258 [Rhizoctonia solani]|uniref:Uncharacterized protein n=1 Tax=Rhizoctonia solani TaxID=456999 RepID=A0A0K6FXE6_9AGAM|nr:hypothetical protein RSOLAG22IIIB_04258 [Rhizoctonia solani]
MACEFSVPFELPPAPPGFLNVPQPPTSVDQITLAYLASLIIYSTKLKYSHILGLIAVEPQMLAKVHLHEAWITRHLLNQAQPPSVDLPPNAQIVGLRALLAEFRDVNNKFDGLTKDVKNLQTEGIAANQKINNLTASIEENEAITEIRNIVNHHTEILRNLEQTSIDTSENLTRLRRGLARVDRVQCQLFNASRANHESWLPICDEDGVLPSERNLVEVRSRDHLNRLENREIADLLVFYGRIPPDFPTADTPTARAANFVKQSQTWVVDVQCAHLGALSDIFTSPIKTSSNSQAHPN